jgi:uncharacterized protein YdaU (DUF1376 family)
VSLPYYPMFPKDFDASEKVRVMTWSERGLYITLLNHSWLNDGLPVDAEHVRRVCGADRDEFAQMWPQVERCFPETDDGRRRNPRQEEERVKASARHAERSASGRKGNAKRWGERSFSESLTDRSGIARASGSGSGSGDGGEKGGVGEKTGMEMEPSSTRTTHSVCVPTLTRTTHSLCAEVKPILDDLDEIYRKAGAPIPEKHKQVAWQLLLEIPPERRARVPNYCKWALVSGKWPNPAKTKALVNVLRDGDWDVEIAPRILPMPAVSARELAQERAAEKFRRMP